VQTERVFAALGGERGGQGCLDRDGIGALTGDAQSTFFQPAAEGWTKQKGSRRGQTLERAGIRQILENRHEAV